MRIAIVGSSLISENQLDHVRDLCEQILEQHDKNTTVISGGAKGVDRIALDTAHELGYETKEYQPTGTSWEHYKERNLQMAKDCDKLYCISTPVHFQKCYHHEGLKPQDHEKTAGCWTMNKALEAKKPCKFLMTPTIKTEEHELN